MDVKPLFGVVFCISARFWVFCAYSAKALIENKRGIEL
ncbi:hypothetical protein HNQ44_000927 [Planomicrobium koreense]|uniref:Uncharacterized protein n=1 Tax=Planococcus koreensis TaxID=112331 RepID=A0A7W8CQ42_9BACL|nr:hypothetical protein [Planococcus koreensis]